MINLDLPRLTHDWRWVNGDAYDAPWWCPTCHAESYVSNSNVCGVKVLAWGRQMRESGAEVERSAIVRHLIDRAEDVRDTPACYDFTNQLATEIENLEHNQED